MKNNKGFTLLEIIIVLLLVGILSAVAGMGLVTGVKGYLFAKENAPTAQKVVLAISRLSREFQEIYNVTNTYNNSSSSLTYEHVDGFRSVALVGGGINKEIKMLDGTTLPNQITGDTLINNVNSFSIAYCKYGQSTNCTWTPSEPASLLARIKVTLVINRADSGIGTLTFTSEINPRNTGTYNVPVKF